MPIDQGLGRHQAAANRERNPFPGDRIGEARCITHQQHAVIDKRPSAWSDGNDEAMSLDLSHRTTAKQVKIARYRVFEIASTPRHRQHSDRQMLVFRKGPGIPIWEPSKIKSRLAVE